jgi:hypothetical protein
MYIDGLTITAFVVIVIALVMFVKGCIFHNCGSPCNKIEDCDDGTRHYKV